MRRIEVESNFTQINLRNHVDRHREHFKYDSRFSEDMSDEEFMKVYDEIGDELPRKKVGAARSDNPYAGYINKDGRRIKYNRRTGDFVVYGRDKTTTLHKKSYKEYLRTLKRDFASEFPYNEGVENNG